MKTDQATPTPAEARCLTRGNLTDRQRAVYDAAFRDCQAGGMTGDQCHECAMDMATRVTALQEFIATLCLPVGSVERAANWVPEGKGGDQ